MVSGGLKVSVCAFMIAGMLAPVSHCLGKDSKDHASITSVTAATNEQFQWCDHNRLTWNDFRGRTAPATHQSAAATHCGITISVKKTSESKPVVVVTNTFFANTSWVREDGKVPEVLLHEQGHFDLCEIYTRIMKKRLAALDMTSPDIKAQLQAVYNEVNSAYELRQQAYELETTHGSNPPEQKRWVATINNELGSRSSSSASVDNVNILRDN